MVAPRIRRWSSTNSKFDLNCGVTRERDPLRPNLLQRRRRTPKGAVAASPCRLTPKPSGSQTIRLTRGDGRASGWGSWLTGTGRGIVLSERPEAGVRGQRPPAIRPQYLCQAAIQSRRSRRYASSPQRQLWGTKRSRMKARVAGDLIYVAPLELGFIWAGLPTACAVGY